MTPIESDMRLHLGRNIEKGFVETVSEVKNGFNMDYRVGFIIDTGSNEKHLEVFMITSNVFLFSLFTQISLTLALYTKIF